ncbi:SAM-dependent methyltransferase [Vibrio sp. DW001]|uniref:methyltransferase n=1 Tax=Vibrio sp. DW001 TaxID=2912315 RepID=UPI0023AF5EAD|nr:methyltransferase [Vibrio sp. DW001]WED27726.1 SAM-dependent methyltransferase [Vibrio sp. DW001]
MQSVFLKLEHILQQNQSLWRFEPFHQSIQSQLACSGDYPDLCQWLSSLSIEQVRRYKSSTTELMNDVTSVFPQVEELRGLISLSMITKDPISLERGLESGIPGRKLGQIVSMGSFALAHHKGTEWLEWCSGKGYLGRILASRSTQPVISFEWQISLCEKGQQEAIEKSLPMTFIQGDALSEKARDIVTSNQHVVALHACGDLHVRLIQHASAVGSQAISISPCCYHLIENEKYQPLSEQGLRSTLNLTKAELRIPLQETVTGGKRVSRHREEEMRYRLGFDLVLKNVLGIDSYVAVPSVKKSMLSEGFEHFCNWAAKEKDIILPVIDFALWESEGGKRFWQMERQSLLQQMFRRALELWLVYDRALFLQQNGYQVSVAEFCEREVTPRNIMIHAVKRRCA